MKVLIECTCGNKVELRQENQGNQSYTHNNLIPKKFSLRPEIEVNKSCDMQSISKLRKSLKSMSEYEIEDLVDVECKTTEMRINCNKCGNYIVLTQIEQFA